MQGCLKVGGSLFTAHRFSPEAIGIRNPTRIPGDKQDLITLLLEIVNAFPVLIFNAVI
jgi:hypothetical protein